jgi:hypothetical protein
VALAPVAIRSITFVPLPQSISVAGIWSSVTVTMASSVDPEFVTRYVHCTGSPTVISGPGAAAAGCPFVRFSSVRPAWASAGSTRAITAAAPTATPAAIVITRLNTI